MLYEVERKGGEKGERLYWIENSVNKRWGNGKTDSESTHIPSNLISCLISGSPSTMPQLGQSLNPPSRHGSTLSIEDGMSVSILWNECEHAMG